MAPTRALSYGLRASFETSQVLSDTTPSRLERTLKTGSASTGSSRPAPTKLRPSPHTFLKSLDTFVPPKSRGVDLVRSVFAEWGC